MPATLLKTKLYIPPAHPHLVPRPRLIHQLNEGLQRKLILVSAPPGFGKTTLIIDWIQQFTAKTATPKPQVAWVALDEQDNDLARFWSYVVAALETVQPELEAGPMKLLFSPQPPSIEVALTGLINTLVALPHPLVLVLDDYHLIENKAIHDALSFLLDHLPPQLHLVLTSRSDPPLPLTRLRARGQLVELRARDLRFTSSEAATFLNQRMNLNLSPEDIIALEARTEGWIAGLQLAALSMQGQSDTQSFVQAFTGSHRYIIDYLAEEVLARQPEPLQRFLLRTSVLQRLCASLCDALVAENGSVSSQATLLHLEQTNLFLIPLDNKRRWYRYHRLFADVLRERLLHFLSEEEIVELHRRASAWYAANDLISEAISHALAATDFEQAARLIEQIITTVLTGGEITTVMSWLKSLPESFLLSHPRLSLSYGWALLITSQWDKVETYLRAAERMLPPRPQAKLEEAAGAEEILLRTMWGEAIAMRAMLLTNLGFGDVQQAVKLCEQALEWLPEDSLVVRSIIVFTLGSGYEALGDLPRASQTLAEAVDLSERTNNLVVALSALNALARLKEEQGHLQEAVAFQQRALELVERQFGTEGHPDRLPPVAGRVYLDMAEILREQDRLEQAKKFLTISLELGRKLNIMGNIQISHIVLARVLQAQGDETGALEAIQQAEQLTPPSLPIIHWVRAIKTRLYLAQGNLAEASAWAEEYPLPLGADFNYTLYPGEYATLVRLLMAQERFDEALDLLEQMQAAARAGGIHGRLTEIMLLRALVLYAQGNPSQALAPLAQALTLGETGGLVRLFMDEGLPLARLLHLARSRNAVPNPAYVDRLLAAFPEMAAWTPDPEMALPPSPPPTAISEPKTPQRHLVPPLIEPLSDRELEVMGLVAAGLSNQEIAENLVIAEGTVKKHLHNIFGKLEVRSRTQAVVRATELGLL